jgi:hypothetical protein
MKKFLIENIVLLLVIILLCFSTLFNVVKVNYRITDIENRVAQETKSVNKILAEQLSIPEKYFEKFVAVCDKYGVNSVLMNNIIKCESSWNHEAKNPGSTAKGLCQFLDGTWNWALYKIGIDSEKVDRFDWKMQLEACAWLIANEDLGHWEETRLCWQDYQVKY